MPIGPQLPPSPGKRKRVAEDEENSSSNDDSVGPQLPQKPAHEEGAPVKKPRVVGPSLPDADGHVKLPVSATAEESSDSSDDDDDFGPALPAKGNPVSEPSQMKPGSSTSDARSGVQAPATTARDEWMTMAPTSGDWSQRIDPTKLKSRKFNTGKGSAPASKGTDSWHETPEQKQARLQRQVLGVKADKDSKSPISTSTSSEQDAETAERMKEYNKQRGPSLYVAHQKKQGVEKDDDPSARAFDREKDIGGGLQMNATKRKEMMQKSGDFNSRFSSAKYL